MSNGKTIPDTPLAVDFWQLRRCPLARLFFLSHMHSDHTAGLTSTWSNWPIYCSPVSARLLKLRLQVKEQWIHPLELGETHMLPLDDIGKERLTVTLIDANHCPGAVMFLFEAYFGCILYTGDFRYTASMLREPCLRTNIVIDVLYLDNTNCDPSRTLPTRQRATQQIKEIIRSHPNHNVVIGLYTLGKESLLVELAMEFKTWIEVSCERMETLQVLELPDVFTTEPGAGRIRVVEQSEIRSPSMQQWNSEYPTLAIIPTSRPLVSYHPNIHVVPYSDHSSYQELEEFVSALKPSRLVPIVGKCVPGSFSALLPHKRRREVLVPESVRNYMMMQPETQSTNPVHSSFLRRPNRPIPMGVIFESPVNSSKLSSVLSPVEEMDAELDIEDPDCVLLDLGKKPSPAKARRRISDLWSLNVVQTISDDLAMEESLTLSQFTQGNFAPVKVLTNTVPSLKPTVKKSEMHADLNSGTVTDDVMLVCNGNMYHQNGHDAEQENSVSLQISSDNDGSNFCFTEQSLQESESCLLLDLPFTEEDMRSCGLLSQRLVKQFPLIPLRVTEPYPFI